MQIDKIHELKADFHDMQKAAEQKPRSYLAALRLRTLCATEIFGAGNVAQELGLGSAQRARIAGAAPNDRMLLILSSFKNLPAPDLRTKHAPVPSLVVTICEAQSKVAPLSTQQKRVFI